MVFSLSFSYVISRPSSIPYSAICSELILGCTLFANLARNSSDSQSFLVIWACLARRSGDLTDSNIAESVALLYCSCVHNDLLRSAHASLKSSRVVAALAASLVVSRYWGSVHLSFEAMDAAFRLAWSFHTILDAIDALAFPSVVFLVFLLVSLIFCLYSSLACTCLFVQILQR